MGQVRQVTPAWGPHRGVLCWREADGSLRPVSEAPALGLPEFAIAQPDSFAFDRETVRLMEAQHIAGGASPEWARNNAVTAARRADSGEPIPYSSNNLNTAASRGHGGR